MTARGKRPSETPTTESESAKRLRLMTVSAKPDDPIYSSGLTMTPLATLSAAADQNKLMGIVAEMLKRQSWGNGL